MSAKIFISYRRDPGGPYAMVLYDRLKERGYDVFIDHESLTLGRFDRQLLDEIANCDYFVLILTENALHNINNNTEDWMRQEIEYALDCDKKIIPILDRKFFYPDMNDLPPALRFLPNYQSIETNMTDPYQMVSVLNQLENYIPKPPSSKKFFVIGTLALVLCIATFFAISNGNRSVDPPVGGTSRGQSSEPPITGGNPELAEGEQPPDIPATKENPELPGGENPPTITPPETSPPPPTEENEVAGSNTIFRASGKKISGSNNQIYGNDNEISGSNNEIYGDRNDIYGSNNDVTGNYNKFHGSNNTANGVGNQSISGSNNDV